MPRSHSARFSGSLSRVREHTKRRGRIVAATQQLRRDERLPTSLPLRMREVRSAEDRRQFHASQKPTESGHSLVAPGPEAKVARQRKHECDGRPASDPL